MGQRTCRHCGVALPGTTHDQRRKQYCSLPCFNRRRWREDGDGDPPAPTPDEVAHRAAEVRAGWSEAERLRRLRPDWRALAWNVPRAAAALTHIGVEIGE